MGTGRSFNGARETEPMERFIRQIAANKGSKGGSTKCRPGMFKRKIKDAVVPLCESHYPDDKAKILAHNCSSASDAPDIGGCG